MPDMHHELRELIEEWRAEASARDGQSGTNTTIAQAMRDCADELEEAIEDKHGHNHKHIVAIMGNCGDDDCGICNGDGDV